MIVMRKWNHLHVIVMFNRLFDCCCRSHRLLIIQNMGRKWSEWFYLERTILVNKRWESHTVLTNVIIICNQQQSHNCRQVYIRLHQISIVALFWSDFSVYHDHCCKVLLLTCNKSEFTLKNSGPLFFIYNDIILLLCWHLWFYKIRSFYKKIKDHWISVYPYIIPAASPRTQLTCVDSK